MQDGSYPGNDECGQGRSGIARLLSIMSTGDRGMSADGLVESTGDRVCREDEQ